MHLPSTSADSNTVAPLDHEGCDAHRHGPRDGNASHLFDDASVRLVASTRLLAHALGALLARTSQSEPAALAAAGERSRAQCARCSDPRHNATAGHLQTLDTAGGDTVVFKGADLGYAVGAATRQVDIRDVREWAVRAHSGGVHAEVTMSRHVLTDSGVGTAGVTLRVGTWACTSKHHHLVCTSADPAAAALQRRRADAVVRADIMAHSSVRWDWPQLKARYRN